MISFLLRHRFPARAARRVSREYRKVHGAERCPRGDQASLDVREPQSACIHWRRRKPRRQRKCAGYRKAVDARDCCHLLNARSGHPLKLLDRTGAFRALSYPNYFWFWSSYFVSNVGSWMQSIAMGWLLFRFDRVAALSRLVQLFAHRHLIGFFILGGIMSDRIDRRKVMLWSQFIAAGTSLVLALLVTRPIDPDLAYFSARRAYVDYLGFRTAGKTGAAAAADSARRFGECTGPERGHVERRRATRLQVWSAFPSPISASTVVFTPT